MDASAISAEEREARFERWMQCHQGLIYKVVRSFVGRGSDGDDLAQEIRLQLWQSLPRYGGAAKESTWIYRVCLNTALAWKRGERRWAAGRAPSDGLNALPDIEEPRRQEREDQLARLYAAIRRLPRVEAALILLYLDDLSYREISEVLGISESHVGVKLHRARKTLAHFIQEESHE